MPFDRKETLKRAETLLRQDRLERAIAEYSRVLEDQPSDWATANILGDLYVRAGEPDRAAAQYGRVAEHFMVEGFSSVRLDPGDQHGRLALAKASIADGDVEAARAWLKGQRVMDDPGAWLTLLEIELDAGRFDEARELARRLIASGPAQIEAVLALAWAIAESRPDAAYVLVGTAVDAAAAAARHADAAAWLQEFGSRVPSHLDTLRRLVEVCVDGGLEQHMSDAQSRLADGYLAAGRASEARTIAEALVAREPWEHAHIERFRRALVLLDIPEPDTVIAERLGGTSPFTSTDPFAEDLPGRPAGDASPPADEPIAPAPAEPVVAVEDPPAGGETPPRRGGADRLAHHMALARTYLEIGMQDDAVKSLEAAAESPPFRFEAASLLGRIYRDRGETAAAVEWLDRAADVPAPGVEEGRALLYDLGVLVEDCGDTARALAILLELQAEAGEYRDLAERVERLARVQTGG